MKLEDLLIVTPGIKQASIDIPNRQQYESDFGKMAYVFLQDRVPQMIPYLVGFEVVEQEPDGTKAVGMFGFRVSSRFYYVPVFFINNQIKGMESIYDREADLMYPLMEEVVNDIINRKNIEIGGPPDEADVSKDLAAPDLTVLKRPPNKGSDGYKYASAMHDFCSVWNDMQKKASDMFREDTDFQKMFGNAVISVKGGEFEKSASSDLVTYLTHYGGPEAVKALWSKFASDVNYARAAATFYDLKEELSITEFDSALAPKRAQAALVNVITPDNEHTNLGEAEGTKLLSQGFVIKDEREEDDKSEVYSYEPTSEIVNPQDKGVYNVALAGNRTEKCMILKPSIGRINPHMVIVRKVDGTDSFTASSDRVFILGSHEDPQDLKDAVKSQSINLSEAKDNTQYVLVDEEGNCSTPFRIRYGASEDREHVNYVLSWCDNLDYTGSNAQRADHEWVRRVDHDSSYHPQDDELIVRPGKGKAKMLNESLVVPEESYKLLAIEKGSSYGCAMPCDMDGEGSKPEQKFYPASYTEVTDNLIKQSMHELRVDAYDQGSSFLISLNGMKDSREPVNYKSASVRLVRDYGLPVDKTEIILKEASTRFKTQRMVKLAQMVQMPPMQQPPDPYMGSEGVPIQQHWENTQEGNTAGQGPMPAQPRFGGEAELQQGMDPMALAQEAAAMGQQQVFDHAGIAGLAGTNDTSAMIDTFIPTWTESLDKLGRLLFLFYWKNEEFAERFGSDDVADLEDNIRNVYNKFGELLYELKKKTIGAQAGDLL